MAFIISVMVVMMVVMMLILIGLDYIGVDLSAPIGLSSLPSSDENTSMTLAGVMSGTIN